MAWMLAATPSRSSEPACKAVDWLCVAECADQQCVDGCLGKGCNAAAHKYMACTHAACPDDDAGCTGAAAGCGDYCQAAFGSSSPLVGPSSQQWSCRANKGEKVSSLPEDALGVWLLDGASIPAEENSPDDDKPPMPRADFRRRLNLLADDCFAMESLVEEPTLGAENQITVRLLGHLKYQGGKLTLTPEAREARTQLCGQSGTRPLAPRAMTVKTYRFELEGDELTLTDTGADRQTLHYRRAGTTPKGTAPPPELP